MSVERGVRLADPGDPYIYGGVTLPDRDDGTGESYTDYGHPYAEAINMGKVLGVFGAATFPAFSIRDFGRTDVDFIASGYTDGNANGDNYGVVVLWIDSNNYYRGYIRGGGSARIESVVGGMVVNEQSAGGFTAGDNTFRDLRLEVIFPVINLYHDGAGTPDLTHTLSSGHQDTFAAATRAGLYLNEAGGDSSPVITEWTAT